MKFTGSARHFKTFLLSPGRRCCGHEGIQDLRFIAVRCRYCNTKVTLDLDMETQPRSSRFVVPRECPRCQTPFDSAIPGAIEALQRIYKPLAATSDVVSFTPADEPEADVPGKPPAS